MDKKKQSGKILWYIICLLALGLIIGFIVPAFQIPKPSNVIVCLTNLHSWSICFQVYQKDEDWGPAKENWCDLLQPYAEDDNRNIYLCPVDKTGPCSYAMNENIPADANDLPDDLVLLFESTPGWNQVGGADDVVTNRHDRPGASIAFADGHVEFVKPEDIPNLRWTVDKQKRHDKSLYISAD